MTAMPAPMPVNGEGQHGHVTASLASTAEAVKELGQSAKGHDIQEHRRSRNDGDDRPCPSAHDQHLQLTLQFAS
jgi:hypothetical protein